MTATQESAYSKLMQNKEKYRAKMGSLASDIESKPVWDAIHELQEDLKKAISTSNETEAVKISISIVGVFEIFFP